LYFAPLDRWVTDYYRVVEIPWNETQNYLATTESDEAEETQQSDSEQLELPF